MSKKKATLRASHLAKFVKPFRYTWTHFRFEREWEKFRIQENAYFGLFNTKTLAIYFSHGKIREEEAWDSLMSHFQTMGKPETPRRESKRKQAFNKHEIAYAKRDPELKGESMAFKGNEGIDAKAYEFDPYNLKAKPDGIIGDHVIEIKCPVGKLPDGIARNYQLQMFVEMACHNKRKAYFYQYYNPAGWYYFYEGLRHDYFHLSDLNPDDVVYRPWFDNDYTMLVIFQRVERILNAHDDRKGDSLADKFWNYCKKVENLPRPDRKLKGEKAKDAWEDHRETAIYLISQLSEEKLIAHGFTGWLSRCIIDALSMEGNDMKMGRVLTVDNERNELRVLWEGERIRQDDFRPIVDKNTGAFEECISFRQMRRGIIHIMSHMNYQISGKPESEWFTWAQDLKHDHLTHLPPKPPIQYSLHEVSITEEQFKRISHALKMFLMDLHSGTYPFKRNKNPEGSGDRLVSSLNTMKCTKILLEPRDVVKMTPKKRPHEAKRQKMSMESNWFNPETHLPNYAKTAFKAGQWYARRGTYFYVWKRTQCYLTVSAFRKDGNWKQVCAVDTTKSKSWNTIQRVEVIKTSGREQFNSCQPQDCVNIKEVRGLVDDSGKPLDQPIVDVKKATNYVINRLKDDIEYI